MAGDQLSPLNIIISKIAQIIVSMYNTHHYIDQYDALKKKSHTQKNMSKANKKRCFIIISLTMYRISMRKAVNVSKNNFRNASD